MILGFLGKGGSGKSSISSQMALLLSAQDKSVLAIDADHNMDLSYNLASGEINNMPYFSSSLSDFLKATGLANDEKYTNAFLSETDVRFAISPPSREMEKYSKVLKGGIRLMTAGPQTENVLYGKACSHILTTPLKVLLPLLELNENEVVVVDEKAGADGVSTGIVTGIDVGVIACEPSLHSIKTAKQIAELMDFYETPYVFVGNKHTSSDDKDFIRSGLRKEPVTFLKDCADLKRNPSALVTEWASNIEAILSAASNLNQGNRLARTVKKFKRNYEFAQV